MIVLGHNRRRGIHFDVTQNPTQIRLARQVTEAFPWDTAPRYLLRDRDALYGRSFRDRVRAMGIKEVITATRSPWRNAYVERLIGSIRRERLDHVVILDEAHRPRARSSPSRKSAVCIIATSAVPPEVSLRQNRRVAVGGGHTRSSESRSARARVEAWSLRTYADRPMSSQWSACVPLEGGTLPGTGVSSCPWRRQ